MNPKGSFPIGWRELAVGLLVVAGLYVFGIAYELGEQDLVWWLESAWKLAVLLLLVDIWRRTRKERRP